MGPNMKYLPGKYWDFWDHYIPLTETSLKEALVTRGFGVDVCIGRFLPYTMDWATIPDRIAARVPGTPGGVAIFRPAVPGGGSTRIGVDGA